MKSSALKVGDGCTIGNMSVVLYDTQMEPGAVLGPLSLLMKGEMMPQGCRWHGIPDSAGLRTRASRQTLVSGVSGTDSQDAVDSSSMSRLRYPDDRYGAHRLHRAQISPRGNVMLPLTGVKVVELANNIAGPYAGYILAMLGADVLKIERPESGDDARGWGRRSGAVRRRRSRHST